MNIMVAAGLNHHMKATGIIPATGIIMVTGIAGEKETGSLSIAKAGPGGIQTSITAGK